ncbi:DUF3693 domain-containing protein [Xanthomonas phaseoli pv. phaseoli]|uniref:DUF3693 domain-containing protein n=1 Tax=Xanthomonas phaseoli TaxID=1985254 RepID=UPI0022275490|nr:DUF3693 domain-containing protein [Xanthomonas phaseoli]UZB23024.1 DUF3693 domain-containing protein [Xanthomonas phaseoli pv. phaseoli]
MPSANELLDRARTGAKLPSDNALAQRLGVTRAVISNWRKGRNPMPDERIAQICALAKLDGGEWMAKIHAEAAASPAEKALWRSVLDRLSAAAAVVALLVLAVHTGAHEALLVALSPVAITPTFYTLCEKAWRAVQSRARWLWLWLTSLLPSRGPSDTEIAA